MRLTRWRMGSGAVIAAALILSGTLSAAAMADDDLSREGGIPALLTSAQGGDQMAEFQLGTLYSAGYRVVQDYVASAQWLRKSADQGNADAQCELGMLYQTSTYADTPPADLATAARWYEKSAALHNGCGEFALGGLFQSGQGEPRDQIRAQALFVAAAAQGYVPDKTSFPLQQLYAHFHVMARNLAGVKEDQ